MSVPERAAPLKSIFRVLLSLLLLSAGTMHFIHPAPFAKIVPDYLPAHLALVYASGFFEILGGAGLLIPLVSRTAAWGIVALLIAVFPANVNMAVNHIAIGGLPPSPALYWLRLPLQAVLIAWAWWFTR